ncbi:MAG: EscU/YscU/HrcU family type III secretion system export apparatus switch protein [Actinobacteria bacterium]|nr:EscU/YscU/HrcU family type III secretion system export apparatus switch protein [Actinomycetota bacterium]
MPDRRPRPRRATALSYSGSGAPRVVASGRGLIAERILRAATAAGVPVRQDATLAAALATLELDREIPEALYLAVAEALAWAYALDARAAGRQPPAS